MCSSTKHRLVTSLKLLKAIALCLALSTHPALAQSVTNSQKIVNVVPTSAGEFIGFVIKKGETAVNLIVETPVNGLIYFDVNSKIGAAVEANFLSKNGDDLGIGGVRLALPGRVRVRIARRNSRDTDRELRFEGRFVLLENDPDTFEPNDMLEAARIFRLGPDTPIVGGPAMIFPAGDTDWFRLQVTAPGEITPYILRLPGNRSTVRLLDAKGRQVSLHESMRVKSGMLVFKVVGIKESFELMEVGFSYSPIWDDCNSNMRREDACMLRSGTPVNITLRPHMGFTGDKNQSAVKWYSMSTLESGYIMLSLSGLPTPKYNLKNIQTAGLKLQAKVFFSEGGNLKNIAAHVSHGSIIFRTKEPGTYKIGLRGNWFNADPLRAMKLTPYFQRYIATSIRESRLAIMSMAPDNQSGQTALGLALLAGVGGGYYTDARTPEKIKSVMKEFIGGIDRKPANVQPETPATVTDPRHALTEPETPNPVLTATQIELKRLNGLRTYLETDKEGFLYRHYFRTPSGEILKRLEKTKLPGKVMAKHAHTNTEKLSLVISRRLLVRTIQNLE